ncbi:MAG: YggS family pyridoxal phosphate-dependent enzyme [Chitinophagales bacterium]
MDLSNYQHIIEELSGTRARLVAVSKTKPHADILFLYNAGQRLFGENKVQELLPKHDALPKDIEWHMIGHLQSNKVKQIVPFVSLIHSVDSPRLLAEINKQAVKCGRVVDCLLQLFIADEDTKFGFDKQELLDFLASTEFTEMRNVRICGLMGMATNTDDEAKVSAEFAGLKALFDEVKVTYFTGKDSFKELSMGMSQDYKIAVQHGATLIRIGSLLFGERR